jgi:general secretion pathway protein J
MSPVRQKAFTLIEMLVVMVIISLLITVIMQGFGYSMGLFQRVQHIQKNAYNEVLAYNWLRSSLAQQVAARPGGQGLEGQGQRLVTYSFEPLVQPSGAKTLINWQLVQVPGYLQLQYEEAGQKFLVYQWAQSTGVFEYLDREGGWQRLWPTTKVDPPRLPEAIRLLVHTGSETRNYVVVVASRKQSEVTMDEVLYGR